MEYKITVLKYDYFKLKKKFDIDKNRPFDVQRLFKLKDVESLVRLRRFVANEFSMPAPRALDSISRE